MLADRTIAAASVKTAWEGVMRTIPKDDFAAAF